MLMTTALAARRLGVSHERLLDWVARKLLPIVGEDEEGRVLLREPVIMERGEALAAETPERLRSPRLRKLWTASAPARVLPCGCAFAWDVTVNNEPLIRCADARGLEATVRLAEAFQAVAPSDPFFRQLAEVTRNALARHLEVQPASYSSGAADRRDSRVNPERGCVTNERRGVSSDIRN